MSATLPQLKPGQRNLSASRFNYLVDKVRAHDVVIDKLDGQALAALERRKQVAVRRLIVVNGEEEPDTILCREYEDRAPKIRVAKPYLLRRTPFDGLERDGVKYTYESNIKRKAEKGDDEWEENLEPPYVADDVIYAVKGVAHGTDLYQLGITQGQVEVSWIDLNVDGRSWSKPAMAATIRQAAKFRVMWQTNAYFYAYYHDLMVCQKWDNEEERWEAAGTYVAKPLDLRASLFEDKTVGGYHYTYPYIVAAPWPDMYPFKRQSLKDGTTDDIEIQRVTPSYYSSCEIIAVPCEPQMIPVRANPDEPQEVHWQEIGTRGWAKEID